MLNTNAEKKILNISILPLLFELDDILVNTSYAMYEFMTQNTLVFEPYFDFTKVLSKKEFNDRKYRNFYDWLFYTNKINKNPKITASVLVTLYNTLNTAFYNVKNCLFDQLLPNEFSNKIFGNKYIQNENAFKNIVIIIRDNNYQPEITHKINFINRFYKSINQNINYVILKNSEDLYKELLKKYSNFGLLVTDDISLVTKLIIETKSKHEYLLPSRGYTKSSKLLKDISIEYRSNITYF